MSGSPPAPLPKPVRPGRWRRRLLRLVLGLVMAPPVLLGLIVLLVYLPPVQERLRASAIGRLQARIGTPVELGRFRLRYPAGIALEGLLLLDQQGDTLLRAGELRTDVDVGALIDGRLSLRGTRLRHVRAVVEQYADSSFNFTYILRALAGDTASVKEAVADSTAPMPFSMDGVELEDIRADLRLGKGLDIRVELGAMTVRMDEMDAAQLRFHAPAIALAHARVDVRAPSAPQHPDTYPALTNPFAGLDIALNELDLKDVAFHMLNSSTGDSLWLELPEGHIVVDSLALPRQRMRFGSLAFEGARFGILDHSKGDLAENERARTPPWLDQHDGFRYWVRGLDIAVGELAITRGELEMHRDTLRAGTRVLDPAHIRLGQLTLRASEATVNDSTLALVVHELSAHGTGATALRTAMRVHATPGEWRVEQGELALNGTLLHVEASARPGEMSRVYRSAEEVPLQVHLSSALALEEMPSLFATLGVPWPLSHTVKEVWRTDLAFSGTLQRADTVSVSVEGDRGTVLQLQGRLASLRSPLRHAFIADVREVTMGQGLYEVLRAFVPPDVQLPTRFTATARVSGNGERLTAGFAVKSDLGDVSGRASADAFSVRMPDGVSADLLIEHLALQRFTGDTALGALDAHLVMEGEALNSAGRTGRLELQLAQMNYHGQDLAGSRITVNVEGDSVHAEVDTRAPALTVALRADARWPVGSDTLSGTMDMDVAHLLLHEMGWYPYPLGVQGQWHGQGRFSADGFAEFALSGDSVRLSNPERSFTFEGFELLAHIAPDSTRISLNSDALELDYDTNLPADSLLPRTREKLLSFFRTDSSFTSMTGQRMDLRVALPRTEWLTGLVLPDLQAIELEKFTGHYDSDADELDLDIRLPVLRYRDIAVLGLRVNADAKEKELDGALRIDSVRYNAFRVEGLSLTAASAPGVLRTELSVAGEGEKPKYMVPVEFSRASGDIRLHLAEGLLLDTVAWTVDPENELRFTDAGAIADHFVLTSGERRAELATTDATTTVRLEKFNLGALTNIVSMRDSTAFVAGELTGEVVLPLRSDRALSADMRMDHLAVSGKPIGDLVVAVKGSGPGTYAATAHLESGANRTDIEAHYDGAQAPAAMDARADIGFTDMAFLRPFVDGFLFELGGGLSGTVYWRKLPVGNSVKGDLTFTNAVLGVRRTGARYTLRQEHLLADAEGITLNDFTVRDSLGGAFVLDGRVGTTDLVNMRFDLALRTDSFQLVHSVMAKDEPFYGDLFTAADLRITGTDRAPMVKGELGILAGTRLSVVLPGSRVKLVESDGIVEFTTDLGGQDTTLPATDQERLRDSLRAHLPQVDLDLGIRVDDRAAFAIVLDPTTGDQATFQGAGDLRFRYDSKEEMRLSGPFTLSQGGYTLEFYGLVKKRFELVPGGTITWDGDPIGARMDIHARYTSETAAYPLVANATGSLSEAERNRLSSRLPFEVIIHVDGAMKKPDIGFAIDLPRAYRNTYPQVNERLEQLADQSLEEERNRQVFGLLVLNSFIQDEASGGAPSSGLATSAARGSVNGILTDQMNKLTGRYVKGVDIQLGVSTIDQSQGARVYQRTSVDYKVSKSFLNKRLSFEVGGSVGVDEDKAATGNVSSTRAAQYAIVYDLSGDGRLRLRGFYENAFDLYDGEITDSGVALMHTRDLEENEKAREAARKAAREQQMEMRRRARGGKTGERAP